MKLSYAAAFSSLSLIVAAAFSLLVARPGFRIASVQLPRQVWLADQAGLWHLNWWLWLLFIFSWMTLLATFMWRYTPVHRVTTMLQTGLMSIAAVLTIIGVLIWMNLLPISVTHDEPMYMVHLVDSLAISLLGAGCFMAGITTAWMGIDLWRLGKLSLSWLLPGILAGLALSPSPFLLPQPHNVLLAGVIWLIWCAILLFRGAEPKPFPEYSRAVIG